MPHGMNWPAVYVLAKAGTSLLAKELTMRNKVLAIAAILGAIAAPIAAQAQTTITTGTAGGSTVVIGEHEGIVAEQPETGVTYYDVPQTFGMTPYRYTVVNGQTVLVEPRSRRIVQVVD
jgi:3-hydroxy-3-methylglutaryl CoA synthase